MSVNLVLRNIGQFLTIWATSVFQIRNLPIAARWQWPATITRTKESFETPSKCIVHIQTPVEALSLLTVGSLALLQEYWPTCLAWNILHLVYRFSVNKQTAFLYTVLISGVLALLKWWQQSLTSVNVKNIVVWNVTSCTMVEVLPLFRRNILPSASGWNFIFECGRNMYLRNRCLITLKVKVNLFSYRPAQIPRAPGG